MGDYGVGGRRQARQAVGPLSPGDLSPPKKASSPGSPSGRVPTRRAPISPSQSCEVCRAYYQDETDLNQEVLGVLRDFPWQMQVQDRERERLLVAEQLWSQDPHPAISPDILLAHYRRKEAVTSLVGGFLQEQEAAIGRWKTFHRRAEAHHARISKKLPPAGSPRRHLRGSSSRRSGLGGTRSTPFLTRLPDRSIVDENDPSSAYRRRWFHQKAVAEEGEVDAEAPQNLVDEAEAAARRARRVHAERLESEAQVAMAQLRAELVRARDPEMAALAWHHEAEQPKRIIRTLPKEDALRGVVDLVERPDFGGPDRDPPPIGDLPPCTEEVDVDGSRQQRAEGPFILGQPRSRGDATFWTAASRALCVPEESALKTRIPENVRKRWATSPPGLNVQLRTGTELEAAAERWRRAERSQQAFPQGTRFPDAPQVARPPLPAERGPDGTKQYPDITPKRPGWTDPADQVRSLTGQDGGDAKPARKLPPYPLQDSADRLQAEQRKLAEPHQDPEKSLSRPGGRIESLGSWDVLGSGDDPF